MELTYIAQVDLESENAALREELRNVRLELHRSDQFKRDFCSLAARELRTPLAVLLGYARILENDLSGPARDRAEVVTSHAWQIKNTVDGIVAIQQIDAGELTLRLDIVDVTQVIQSLIDGGQREITDKELQVQVHSDPNLCVRADRERLALIITNLLSNACKYSHSGGHIDIETRAEDAWVEISIRDDGIGIPPEDQALIFEPFHQSDKTRKQGGLGIGLTVAKLLVESHGGRMWLESAVDQGSVFSFSIPRAMPGASRSAGQGAHYAMF